MGSAACGTAEATVPRCRGGAQSKLGYFETKWLESKCTFQGVETMRYQLHGVKLMTVNLHRLLPRAARTAHPAASTATAAAAAAAAST